MSQLTLHEAMVVILRRHGGGWMSRDDMARGIAADKLFLRPSDGQPPPSDQLRLRARKYQELFECSDTACTNIRLRRAVAVELSSHDDAAIQLGTERGPASGTSGAVDANRHRLASAERYRPNQVRLLLVAETPPTSLDRYFYFEDVRTQDSLFRFVGRAVLQAEPTRDNKADLLTRLRDSGVFLVDLKPDPKDGQPLRAYVPDLVDRVRSLAPESVILIKATVYDAAFAALKHAGLPVIDERIPFPGSGQQKRFQEAMARALAAASFDSP